MTFDELQVTIELNRLYAMALKNYFSDTTSLAFASNQLHEELDVIVRKWTDRTIDELRRTDTPQNFKPVPYDADAETSTAPVDNDGHS